MKKFRRKLFALALACVLASSAMAGCGGSDNGSGSGSGGSNNTGTQTVSTDSRKVREYSKVVVPVGGKPVYCAGTAMFTINDDDSVELVRVADGVQYKEGNALNNFSFSVQSNVVMETDAFGTYYNNSADIYHWDLSDAKAVKEEILYPVDMVKEHIKNRAVFQGLDEKAAGEMAESYVTDLLAGSGFIDGGDGYLYKSLNAYIEDQGSVASVAFGVLRLSIDGKQMDFIDDIRAGSFAAGNGFMYYYDAGYTYDPKTDSVQIDSSKAGLYRALADGSNKTALVSGVAPSSDSAPWSDVMKGTLSNLRLINTEVFYIDNSANGDNCLYKISTDGGTPEKVSAKKCDNYYYDREGHTLYYFGEGDLWSKNMDTGEETELFMRSGESVYTGGETMAVYGGYLYFADADRYTGVSYIKEGEPSYNTTPSGQRYNLSTGELEALYCRASYTKTETDGSGREVVADPKDLTISWESIAIQKRTSR